MSAYIIFLALLTSSSCLPLGVKESEMEENALIYETENQDSVEKYVDGILSNYFDRFIRPGLEKGDSKYSETFSEAEKSGKMQGDMPNSDIILDNVALKIFLPVSNKTHNFNTTLLTNFLNNTKTSNMSFDFHKQRQR